MYALVAGVLNIFFTKIFYTSLAYLQYELLETQLFNLVGACKHEIHFNLEMKIVQ
jgi:hypothetical protein